jgi:hypothetical protein
MLVTRGDLVGVSMLADSSTQDLSALADVIVAARANYAIDDVRPFELVLDVVLKRKNLANRVRMTEAV